LKWPNAQRQDAGRKAALFLTLPGRSKRPRGFAALCLSVSNNNILLYPRPSASQN
jgi:hypothetical protein